jgi:hypothetical protein
MLFTILLSLAVTGQVNPQMEHSSEKPDVTTLIVVASDRTIEGENDFLVLRSSGNTISWSHICPKGFTAEGVNPEGESDAEGSVNGNASLLKRAFERTLGEIKGAVRGERDKHKRVPCSFSVVLIEGRGRKIRTCQLWSSKQQLQLVHGEELKAVFNDVRKQVFGKSYLLSDLLRVGMDPGVEETATPLKSGRAPPMDRNGKHDTSNGGKMDER